MTLRLMIGVLATLVVGCSSHGGADDRTGYPPENSCPTCPAGGVNPNPPVVTDPYGGGCASASAIAVDMSNGVCQLLSSLGNLQDDRDFAAELSVQRPWWASGGATVGSVQVYRECSSNNAFSTPDFNLAVGAGMYHQLRTQYGSMIGVTVVLAHEWAHQIQFRHGYFQPKVPTRTTELEADLIAGFYVAWTRSLSSSDLVQVLDVLHALGDEHYNNASHHGTPPERKFMELWGYAMAKNALMAGQMVAWDDLHNEARRQLSTMAGLVASGIDGEDLVEQARRALNVGGDTRVQ